MPWCVHCATGRWHRGERGDDLKTTEDADIARGWRRWRRRRRWRRWRRVAEVAGVARWRHGTRASEIDFKVRISACGDGVPISRVKGIQAFRCLPLIRHAVVVGIRACRATGNDRVSAITYLSVMNNTRAGVGIILVHHLSIVESRLRTHLPSQSTRREAPTIGRILFSISATGSAVMG